MSELSPYFRLHRGQEVRVSEMGVAQNAVDVLLWEGSAIEQRALDGEHIVYMPHAQKIRQQWEELKLQKVRDFLMKERGNR